jgi:hypothetical protein
MLYIYIQVSAKEFLMGQRTFTLTHLADTQLKSIHFLSYSPILHTFTCIMYELFTVVRLIGAELVRVTHMSLRMCVCVYI